jgi:hypothetical protein
MRDTLSIDRIDPLGGYVTANVRLVTYHANLAKGPFPDRDLFEMAERLLRTEARRRAYAPRAEDRARQQRLHEQLAPPQDSKTLLYPVHEGSSGVSVQGRHYKSFRCAIHRERNGEWIAEEANVVEVPERLAPEMASLNLTPARRPPEPEKPKPPVYARPKEARKKALAEKKARRR